MPAFLPQENLAEYGNRPLPFIASETETIIYEQARHGTNRINAEPDLARLLVDWLDEFVRPSE